MTVSRDLHERLWENARACRAELPDGSPVWLVTRYAEVRALLADPRLSVGRVRHKPLPKLGHIRSAARST